jgi:hypothetical protein
MALKESLVCAAYLLGLQIYTGNFETSLQGEMVCCFSQCRNLPGLCSAQWGVGMLSMVYGYKMSQDSFV